MNLDSAVLSRVHLRLQRGGTDAERRSTAPYLVHQSVADLFGDREDRPYLYRVTAEWPGGREILVLSTVPPMTPAEMVSPPHRKVVRVESRPYCPHLVVGQRLDFEIRINATTLVSNHLGERGASRTNTKQRKDVWEAVWQGDRRTPLTPAEVYRGYLARKLEGLADIIELHVLERGEIQARRGDVAQPIRFVAANLVGRLTVVDPVRFLHLVVAGMGRSKAFGCGLLLVSIPGTVLPHRLRDDGLLAP